MQKHKIKKYSAFTLAEVLITLAVIGVVAALTIPSVVTSYKKHQTVTQLKKEYTNVYQAINDAISDNGPIQNWVIENENGGNETKRFVDKYLAPYLSIIKNCEYGTTGDCEYNPAQMKAPNIPDSTVNGGSYYKLSLADGTALYFITRIDTNQKYVRIEIDVNGTKQPNVYGKDIFIFIYWIDNPKYTGKLAPNGIGRTRDQYLRSCDKEKDGKMCAGLIMLDGWQIKDDYPW